MRFFSIPCITTRKMKIGMIKTYSCKVRSCDVLVGRCVIWRLLFFFSDDNVKKFLGSTMAPSERKPAGAVFIYSRIEIHLSWHFYSGPGFICF